MSFLGNRIREIRKQNNLTQHEFCKAICISQPHLSKIENGEENPSKSVVKLIGILFNVTEDWLTDNR